MLQIYSNFKMAFNSIPEDQRTNAWVIGFEHIKNQLWTLLENYNVQEIKTVGEKFNAEFHEAVDSVNDEKIKEDVIVKEIRAGYLWHGKVMQAAKVIVNKKEDK